MRTPIVHQISRAIDAVTFYVILLDAYYRRHCTNF